VNGPVRAFALRCKGDANGLGFCLAEKDLGQGP
jgi:hypothetical protein